MFFRHVSQTSQALYLLWSWTQRSPNENGPLLSLPSSASPSFERPTIRFCLLRACEKLSKAPVRSGRPLAFFPVRPFCDFDNFTWPGEVSNGSTSSLEWLIRTNSHLLYLYGPCVRRRRFPGDIISCGLSLLELSNRGASKGAPTLSIWGCLANFTSVYKLMLVRCQETKSFRVNRRDAKDWKKLHDSIWQEDVANARKIVRKKRSKEDTALSWWGRA